MRRTKILGTLGPASDNPEVIRSLIEAGLDAIRLNFSHGSYEYYLRILAVIRRIEKETGRFIPVVADLQGPKIRLGRLRRKIHLQAGSRVSLKVAEEGDDFIPVTYRHFYQDVSPGAPILLDDGRIKLRVLEKKDGTIQAEVEEGGELSSHKGINLPGVAISEPSLTDKDQADLQFIMREDFDFVALSFVRRAEDIRELKRLLHSHGSILPVIAKIEKPEALEELDAIIEESDGIMVARGDLGVEIGVEHVPGIQKELIDHANRQGKITITATQMLETMIENPTPTRAEVSDVANAVFDGSDVVMLSGETSIGKFPVEAVKTMARIVSRAEENLTYMRPGTGERSSRFPSSDAIAHAANLVASDLGARAIVAFSQSGTTCRLIAKYRPTCQIFGASSDPEVLRQMVLLWGVTPLKLEQEKGTDQMIRHIEEKLLEKGLVRINDQVIITAGTPLARPGTTNTLKIMRISQEAVEKTPERYQQNHKQIIFHSYRCIDCGICLEVCPENIFHSEKGRVFINQERLEYCHQDLLCVNQCPVEALIIPRDYQS